jgi:lysozyme
MTAAELIKKWEGLRLHAYPDPATGGAPWTVGYGCTGPGIGPNTVWTEEQAQAALDHRLASVQDVVLGMIKKHVTPGQLAALCSLAWNIGTRALGGSTLIRKLNAGDMRGAADQFLSWDHAAGRVLPGLSKRRAEERRIFLGEL